MNEVIVVATLQAEAGAETALAEVLQALVAPTRKEAGCRRYDLHRDPAAPGTLVFLETWETMAALQAHMRSPHFLTASAGQQGLVAHKEVKLLEQIG